MKIFIEFDYAILCKKVLMQQFDKHSIDYTITTVNEITVNTTMEEFQRTGLQQILETYGINIVDNQNLSISQRIKSAVDKMLNEDDTIYVNTSDYLSEKLNYSYTYLSNLFSEETHTSIENYIILRKIDYAKSLIEKTNLTLTEIAFKLNYSSVAHLSRQFKKTTGLTPSTFQRIIEKRKLKLKEHH